MHKPTLIIEPVNDHTITHNTINTTVYLYMCLLYRIKENGQERIEVEEDGVLKSILINGKTAHIKLCE